MPRVRVQAFLLGTALFVKVKHLPLGEAVALASADPRRIESQLRENFVKIVSSQSADTFRSAYVLFPLIQLDQGGIKGSPSQVVHKAPPATRRSSPVPEHTTRTSSYLLRGWQRRIRAPAPRVARPRSDAKCQAPMRPARRLSPPIEVCKSTADALRETVSSLSSRPSTLSLGGCFARHTLSFGGFFWRLRLLSSATLQIRPSLPRNALPHQSVRPRYQVAQFVVRHRVQPQQADPLCSRHVRGGNDSRPFAKLREILGSAFERDALRHHLDGGHDEQPAIHLEAQVRSPLHDLGGVREAEAVLPNRLNVHSLLPARRLRAPATRASSRLWCRPRENPAAPCCAASRCPDACSPQHTRSPPG